MNHRSLLPRPGVCRYKYLRPRAAPNEMDPLSSALAVLTAMITPAVLISACGTLILSTSTRLGRVVDRVRALSDRLEEMAHSKPELDLFEERRVVIYDQLDKLTSRARILQRSMTVFYVTLGIFVATSVSIGVVAVSGTAYQWIPVVMGLAGAGFLFYGCMLLIFEARLALSTIHMEMDFVWRLSKHHVPADLAGHQQERPRHAPVRRPSV
jgi:Protein of unknown function (DUF2721)